MGWSFRRVTDSAAGATAYSSGLRTVNGYVGVTPANTSCATLFEAAMRHGMKTGFVCTSEVTHATPAGFYAHSWSRNWKHWIAEQLVGKGVSVMLGGAKDVFEANGNELLQKALDKDIRIVNSAAELNETRDIPLLGLFAPVHMAFEIDRPATQPSLKEMTVKALELLGNKQNNKDGFVLLIEGSRIDMAAHMNDAGKR